MASTYIPAKVIKHNNTTFINEETAEVGVIMPIPTPGAGGVLDGDYWATPITDGFFSSFNYYVATPDDVTPPTADSIHVFRLYQQNGMGKDSWYVVGRSTATDGYIQSAAAAECCATAIPLPTAVPVISACQRLCNVDANNKYFAMLSLPVPLPAGRNYKPQGYVNNVLLTGQAATGYANTTTLLAYLNGSAAALGGTWTLVNGMLKLTQTAGSGNDVLCLTIVTVPST